MALIVLATICFLACVFFLFVLVQWMRDTKRKTATRPEVDSKVGEMRQEGHQSIVHSRSAGESRDRFKVGAHRVFIITERSSVYESGYNELERIAYERIARSFKSGKRS